MRILWSCKDWKISRVNFPFPDLQKGSKYSFGRTAKSMKSLRHKERGKRKKEVSKLVAELDIIFVRTGPELPRWDPESSHSSGLVSTAGLWSRPTLYISENWWRYVFVYLVSQQWFEREAGSWVGDEKGQTGQRGPWPPSSPLKPLHWTPVLTGPASGNPCQLLCAYHC